MHIYTYIYICIHVCICVPPLYHQNRIADPVEKKRDREDTARERDRESEPANIRVRERGRA